MGDFGKIFITFGVILIVVGLLFTLGSKIPFLGKLPGDIMYKKDGFTFYAPLATSILISIVLTIVLNLFRK